MNFRTTLIIIVILAGIAGAYFLFFQQTPETSLTNEKPPIHQAYGIMREKVQQLEVTFSDTAISRFEIGKRRNGELASQKPISGGCR